MKKLTTICLLLALGVFPIYAEECPCDGGTTEYQYDCDEAVAGNDSCEPCCNPDAGDPKQISENIDYEKEMSVGPFEIDLPGDCGTITVPELVNVKAEIKGSAEGLANPLEVPIESSVTGTPLAGVGYSLSADGNVKRYVYIDCEGDDCVGPYQGGKPSRLIDFSINFSIQLCSLASWTTPDIFLYRDEKEFAAVEYEICAGI